MMTRLHTLLALAGLLAVHGQSAAALLPPLRHEVYVWQRAWNESVRKTVAQRATHFADLVVLKAEVGWKDRTPHVVQVPVDYKALVAANVPVGLALRIGAYPGPFSEQDPTATFIKDLAASLVADARANQLSPYELQIDFDCAESKLDGYRAWVDAIRRKVAPVPVTITALPSWLKTPAFERLATGASNYVLQVHSLERPKDINAIFTLCDPPAAQSAVERAGRIGVPFRVALPTYGYLMAFDRSGQFVGLSAEGPGKSWPAGVQTREVRADPMAMSRLVRIWATNRPAAMSGIIWYRLPVSQDILNWRWPTLAAMLATRSPRESLRAEARRVEAGLVEINLVNDGEIDFSSRLAVEVRWQGARMVAGDALRDFELADAGASAVRFQNQFKPGRLLAGEEQVIGWLRLDQDCEVSVEIKKR